MKADTHEASGHRLPLASSVGRGPSRRTFVQVRDATSTARTDGAETATSRVGTPSVSAGCSYDRSTDSAIHRTRDRPTASAVESIAVSTVLRLIPAMILMTVAWVPTSQLGNELSIVQSQTADHRQQHRSLVEELERATVQVQAAYHRADTLKLDNHRSFQQLHPKLRVTENAHISELERVETAMFERLDRMEERVRQNAVRHVKQEFGVGPHRVELLVRHMDEYGTTAITTQRIVLQLALLTDMPHTVHHFLSMVDRQLWDGMSLTRGTAKEYAPHTLGAVSSKQSGNGDSDNPAQHSRPTEQSLHFSDRSEPDAVIASPMKRISTSSSEPVWAGAVFEEAGLTALSFDECSDMPFPPQVRYTVAFASDGGPDWMIRTNVEDSDEPVSGDSSRAFAMVTEGVEVVDRFLQAKDGASMVIERMRIAES